MDFAGSFGNLNLADGKTITGNLDSTNNSGGNFIPVGDSEIIGNIETSNSINSITIPSTKTLKIGGSIINTYNLNFDSVNGGTLKLTNAGDVDFNSNNNFTNISVGTNSVIDATSIAADKTVKFNNTNIGNLNSNDALDKLTLQGGNVSFINNNVHINELDFGVGSNATLTLQSINCRFDSLKNTDNTNIKLVNDGCQLLNTNFTQVASIDFSSPNANINFIIVILKQDL
ncbi:MAG: hypothetical protein RCG15_05560 [Candidatus Rickettsia vulgarisii]